MANQVPQGGLPFDPVQRAFELRERRWGGSTSMRAVTSIMRAHQILIAELDAMVRPYDHVQPVRGAGAAHVRRRGALPLSKIGERLQVHATSVTNIIDRLEAAGLVRREPNPRDGRGTLAVITDEGREVAAKATADLMAAEFGLGALDGELDAHCSTCCATCAVGRRLQPSPPTPRRQRPSTTYCTDAGRTGRAGSTNR